MGAGGLISMMNNPHGHDLEWIGPFLKVGIISKYGSHYMIFSHISMDIDAGWIWISIIDTARNFGPMECATVALDGCWWNGQLFWNSKFQVTKFFKYSTLE